MNAPRWLVLAGALACSCRSGPAENAPIDAGGDAAASAQRASAAAPSAAKGRVAALQAAMDTLHPLHRPLGAPKPGEWLAEHPEPGQTFDQYRSSDPVLPNAERRVLYVQPLGDLTATQRWLIGRTADSMSRFFSLDVRIQQDLTLALVPTRAPACTPRGATSRSSRPTCSSRC